SWERRSLDGDRTAYFGQVARQERRESNDQLWRLRVAYTLPSVIHSPNEVTGSERGAGSHWMAIGMRSTAPSTLRRPGSQPFDARANIPLRLTLVSPIGAPKKGLMIRAAIGTDVVAPDWSTMVEIEADPQGSYQVEIPTLAAGDYQILVQVYDLDHPETPYSSSLTPLLVRQP
ncbi:MAG TPA: hypothetical protein VG712_07175, partial [Gemmatimonadales bacterium]|nr:hypothetical protein [Gemmatimonadales bacterium]